MYAITGATGNTGKIISQRLLKAGKKVRVLSRYHDKAKELVSLGAELFIGSHDDADLLKRFFDGVEASYVLIPASFQSDDYLAFQMKYVNAITHALKNSKVKYAVTLSSQGAQHENGNGVVQGLNKMESELNGIDGLHTLHLRPGYFMENTLPQAGVIKQAGVMGSPLKGEINLYMIATKDIGEYAAKRLLALDFEGNNHQDLHGQRDVSYNEVAKIFGKAIGKDDLQYVQFSYDDFKQAMMENWGAKADAADRMNEFIRMINDGKADFPSRTAESTTPTSIEEFAQTFKRVYEST